MHCCVQLLTRMLTNASESLSWLFSHMILIGLPLTILLCLLIDHSRSHNWLQIYRHSHYFVERFVRCRPHILHELSPSDFIVQVVLPDTNLAFYVVQILLWWISMQQAINRLTIFTQNLLVVSYIARALAFNLNLFGLICFKTRALNSTTIGKGLGVIMTSNLYSPTLHREMLQSRNDLFQVSSGWLLQINLWLVLHSPWNRLHDSLTVAFLVCQLFL